MARNKERMKRNKSMCFMINTMFDCGKRVDQDCIVQPKSHKDLSVNLLKESDDNEDIVELIRRASTGNGGGVRVDVDSKGNLVLKSPLLERSYSAGVGRIGRIDEEMPCDFKESDVNKKLYRRCASYDLSKGYVLH